MSRQERVFSDLRRFTPHWLKKWVLGRARIAGFAWDPHRRLALPSAPSSQAQLLAAAPKPKIKQGIQVVVGTGSIKFGPCRGMASATPVRSPNRLDHASINNILLWCENDDPVTSSMIPSLLSQDFGRTRPSLLHVSNADARSIRTMYELIHCKYESTPEATNFTQGDNLLVAVNPSHNLPFLLRNFWPATRLIAVFTKYPVSDLTWTYVDYLMFTPASGISLNDFMAVPFRQEIDHLDQVPLHLRNYISASLTPQRRYYYTLIGSPTISNSAHAYPRPDILIETPSADQLVSFNSYRERIAGLLDSATYVGIDSRFVYVLESWIRESRTQDLLEFLLAQGARMAISLPSEARK